MAFVKDAVLDGFKRDVEFNFNTLEERVIELEKLLKQYNGGVTVDEVVPEPEPEVVEEEVSEPEVVEEEIIPDEIVEEDEEEDEEEEDSSPKSKSKKKK